MRASARSWSGRPIGSSGGVNGSSAALSANTESDRATSAKRSSYRDMCSGVFPGFQANYECRCFGERPDRTRGRGAITTRSNPTSSIRWRYPPVVRNRAGGGALLIAVIFTLLVRTDVRNPVFALRRLGIASHFVIDYFLWQPTGHTNLMLWPVLDFTVGYQGFYRSTDRSIWNANFENEPVELE